MELEHVATASPVCWLDCMGNRQRVMQCYSALSHQVLFRFVLLRCYAHHIMLTRHRMAEAPVPKFTGLIFPIFSHFGGSCVYTVLLPLLRCCCGRSAGGVPAAVALLCQSPSATQQLHMLSLMSALARSHEAAGSELAQAGAPATLLQLVAIEPLPRTQVGCSPLIHPARPVTSWGLRLLWLVSGVLPAAQPPDLSSGRLPTPCSSVSRNVSRANCSHLHF